MYKGPVFWRRDLYLRVYIAAYLFFEGIHSCISFFLKKIKVSSPEYRALKKKICSYVYPHKGPVFRRRDLYLFYVGLYFMWGCNEARETLYIKPCMSRNTLRHTATHCNTYIEIAVIQALETLYIKPCMSRNTLQHTATHCNTLQHTATHCNTLQHTATHTLRLLFYRHLKPYI